MLRGLIFSGCSDKEGYGDGPWTDCHMPVTVAGALMTAGAIGKAVMAAHAAATKQVDCV